MTADSLLLNEVKDLHTLRSICMKTFFPEGNEKLVFGEGPERATLMIIGEAPGAEEAESGLPFVGNSGRLLNKYLKEGDIERESAYVTNILKTRPPQNRKPTNSEILAALPFLLCQIQLVKPKIILCLGSTAFRAIVDKNAKITEVRGNWREWKDIMIMPAFHPSAVFHDEDKRELLKRDLIETGKILKHILKEQ